MKPGSNRPQAVSFENDRFVIGCYNDYGRRWLESRLTTMIRRMVECRGGPPGTG